MANDDLLQQLDKLIEKRLAENNKQQAQDFQNRLDKAVDPIHERLDTQHKNLTSQINAAKTELTEKIDQQTHDVADILAKAVMPDIDRHDTEIKELQKAVGLRPKH
jgi:archaellum component FlaC